jgi:hypothetical protein
LAEGVVEGFGGDGGVGGGVFGDGGPEAVVEVGAVGGVVAVDAAVEFEGVGGGGFVWLKKSWKQSQKWRFWSGIGVLGCGGGFVFRGDWDRKLEAGGMERGKRSRTCHIW